MLPEGANLNPTPDCASLSFRLSGVTESAFLWNAKKDEVPHYCINNHIY